MESRIRGLMDRSRERLNSGDVPRKSEFAVLQVCPATGELVPKMVENEGKSRWEQACRKVICLAYTETVVSVRAYSQMVERKMKVLFTEVFSPSNLTNLVLAVGTVYGIALYEASQLLTKTSWKFNFKYAR